MHAVLVRTIGAVQSIYVSMTASVTDYDVLAVRYKEGLATNNARNASSTSYNQEDR